MIDESVFVPVAQALDRIRAGDLVIVVDDADREHEGDLIGAACHVHAQTINFMVTYARGAFVAVFTPAGWCDRLDIPPMGRVNDSFHQTHFRVAVDARAGGSGSSAADRALTVRLLADPASQPQDFVRPGHVVPIQAVPGGLAQRRGHTEAGVALMALAGIDPPVAVDLEILNDAGDMARGQDLVDFARRHGLVAVRLEDVWQAWQNCGSAGAP